MEFRGRDLPFLRRERLESVADRLKAIITIPPNECTLTNREVGKPDLRCLQVSV